ncbi:MAG: DUF72 domain-containing protein [Anaerohalosphaeraceae bacterium]
MSRRKKGRIWVGTSGWSYEDWAGRFYPEGLSKKDWFAYYARHFSTVELNAPFYHLFEAATYEGWREKAPKGFVFAVKMWRQVTHRRRLADAAEPTERALERAALLGEHLGPILIQLPPGLHREDERLEAYLQGLAGLQEKLGRTFRFVFEFRHESWMAEPVAEMLERFGCGLCLADGLGPVFLRQAVGGFVYVRFHGRAQRYRTLYTKAMLEEWTGWLREQIDAGLDVYAYFNNDYQAYAVQNARELMEMLKG